MLGHRHRQSCHARDRRGSASFHSRSSPQAIRRRRGFVMPNPLWWQCEARQHPQFDGAAGYRWRARRWREPRSKLIRVHRQFLNMRLTCLFLISTLLSAEPPKLPEPFQSIAEQAHSVSPEFAADALLRVVESHKITNAEAQRDLVEQSFRLAVSAKFRVRMRGLPGSMVDTRSGYLSRAYDLKLDALSLVSRAVRDMVPIDSNRARAMFQEIPRPVLTPLNCDDPLVYEVSD